MKLADLFTDPGFAVVTAAGRAPLPPEGLLEGLPAEVTEQARWWEHHMAEIVSRAARRCRAGCCPEARVRPGGRLAAAAGDREGGRVAGSRA